MQKGYVYILANRRNGTIYVGVTSQLEKRIAQHKHGIYQGFSKKYKLHSLVWYQDFDTIQEAIEMEKRIKGKSRAYKMQLIEEENIHRIDLSKDR